MAVLYSFWGSSCSWRVRAALHFKGIVFKEESVDIVREQKQLTEEYRAINPSQKVPAIVMDGVTIVESMAILQYLEETHPQRSLLPDTPLLRARTREICETIVSGIQPLQNIGLKKHFETEQKHKEFSRYFTTRGLESLEDLLKRTAGKFCMKDQITMADLCLVPQDYNGIVSFWGSSCSWRVRAALHFKGIVFKEESVDIVREQKQLTEEYRAINPSQKVPAIVMDGVTIVESMAILQYLEETHPQRSLLPNTSLLRARTREICETIVSGIQPLQNIGLKKHFETEQKHKEFSRYFTTRGLESLEDLLKRTAGKFCIKDQITMADLCLVPQVYNAIVRHNINIKEFPTVADIYEALLKEKMFIETHPENIKRKG